MTEVGLTNWNEKDESAVITHGVNGKLQSDFTRTLICSDPC